MLPRKRARPSPVSTTVTSACWSKLSCTSTDDASSPIAFGAGSEGVLSRAAHRQGARRVWRLGELVTPEYDGLPVQPALNGYMPALSGARPEGRPGGHLRGG